MTILNGRTFSSALALAVAAASLASLAGSAQATPSTLGFYPATDTYAPKTFHFDADVYGRGATGNVSTSFGLEYGIGKDNDKAFGRNELGADYFTFPNNIGGTRRGLFNLKTQLYADTPKGIKVVAGGWGIGSKSFAAPDIGYLLASKAFKFGRIHVGVARSFQDEDVVGDDRTNLHLAYDRAITPKLIFATDYYTGNTTYSGVQPTLYYSVNDKASFGIGYFRGNDRARFAERNQVYLSFDYNFGGPTSAPPSTGEPGPPGAAPGGGTPTG